MTNTWWRKADELIPEQTKLLQFPTSESILIKGPPGSGKTNLLLLRANHLFIGSMPNIYVVVFGGLLKDFIRTGGEQYKFPADQIVTHTSLFMKILSEHGVTYDLKDLTFDAIRGLLSGKIETLISGGKVGILYDALFLDEAQDYTEQEIRIFRRLAKILVATADSRQRIYDVPDCLNVLADCVDRQHVLRFHFRNGLKICRLADAVMNGDPSYQPLAESTNYREQEYPSSVSHKHNLSIESQAEAISEQIRDQRIAYPSDKIGILCPRNKELDAIFDYLARSNLSTICTKSSSRDFDPERPIWLSTLTAAKGLEFRALHIAGLDYLSKMGGPQKRLIYTGITRAKTALTLYSEKVLPPYLNSAIRSTCTVPRDIPLRDIFGEQ